MFQTKRKTFDMKKQRIIDGEHMEIVKNSEYAEKKGKNKPQNQAQEAKKKANKVLKYLLRKNGRNNQKNSEECSEEAIMIKQMRKKDLWL